MKALRIFNAVVLALTATFAVTLGVVSLMYVVNLDASPRLRAEWPAVRSVTAVFWALFLCTGLAWWAQHRRSRWQWYAQALSTLALVIGVATLLRLLRV